MLKSFWGKDVAISGRLFTPGLLSGSVGRASDSKGRGLGFATGASLMAGGSNPI